MPESKKRKKVKNTQIAKSSTEVRPSWQDEIKLSPAWWAPTMVTLMIIGLIWVVVYYMTSAAYPIPKVGQWNIGIGLVIMLSGFLMTLRWR